MYLGSRSGKEQFHSQVKRFIEEFEHSTRYNNMQVLGIPLEYPLHVSISRSTLIKLPPNSIMRFMVKIKAYFANYVTYLAMYLTRCHAFRRLSLIQGSLLTCVLVLVGICFF